MSDRQALEQLLSARIDELRVAAARLGTEDGEALHDLRVAVRRLRALLAPWRRRPAFRAVHRDLRELTRAMRGSGALRDREVRIDWLHRLGQDEAIDVAGHEATAVVFAQAGLKPVINKLSRHLPRALRRDDSHRLLALRDAEARRLLFRIQCALGDRASLPALPTVLHVLRLDCKHLRYLLADDAPAMTALREAQQALGDWRDLDRLAGELTEQGSLPAGVARRLASERRGLLQSLDKALQHLDGLSEADLS